MEWDEHYSHCRVQARAMFLTWRVEYVIKAVKGRLLLRWLVERRNEMDVEMDWRVSTSVHVPAVRSKMIFSFQCTVQVTTA